jgi:hypothetical protein
MVCEGCKMVTNLATSVESGTTSWFLWDAILQQFALASTLMLPVSALSKFATMKCTFLTHISTVRFSSTPAAG